jgi:hypothetical protein
MVAKSVPQFFKDLESAISLLGPYDQVKRAVSHHLMGATLMPTVIEHGRTFTDTRVPLMVAIESGHGKAEIERAIRTYAGGGFPAISETEVSVPLLTYEKPTTRHEQQLLGYVAWEKVAGETEEESGHKDWVAHKGFLSKDLLMLNEAFGEMADPAERDFRAFMNTALDPFTRNEVYKQNLREGALRYMPQVSPCVMMQEQPIPADVWYSGSSRRYLWVVSQRITPKQRREIAYEVIFGGRVPTMPSSVHSTGWRIHDIAVKEPGFSFNYGGVALALKNAWLDLWEIARSKAERVRSLPESMFFPLRDWLYKFSANYAVAWMDEMHGALSRHVAVDEDHLQAAFDDLQSFVPMMIRYLDQHLVTLEVSFLSPLSRQIVSVIAKYGPLHPDETVNYLEYMGANWIGSADQIHRELMVLRFLSVVRQRADGRDEVPGSAREEEEAIVA